MLPTLLILALHAAFAPSTAAQTPTPNADGSYTVPDDWALKPTGFGEGNRFRLLFVSNTDTSAGTANYYTLPRQSVNQQGHAAIPSWVAPPPAL